MVQVKKTINTLQAVARDEYDTIIWDISNQREPITLGGRNSCNHFTTDKTGRCECGAFKGLIRDLPFDEYQQKVLTELAVSPAKNNTIIVTDRDIGKEATIKAGVIPQPKFHRMTWLSKAGSMWDEIPQKEKHLIYVSKDGSLFSSSLIMVNPRFYDDRLFNLGKTLVINPRKHWVIDSNDIHYFIDTEYKKDNK